MCLFSLLYVFFGKMSNQVLCPPFNWIICFFAIEFHRNRKQNGGWQGLEGGGNGEMQVKGYKLSVIRGISSEVLMYSMVTIVSNTVSYTCKLLGVNLKSSH